MKCISFTTAGEVPDACIFLGWWQQLLRFVKHVATFCSPHDVTPSASGSSRQTKVNFLP